MADEEFKNDKIEEDKRDMSSEFEVSEDSEDNELNDSNEISEDSEDNELNNSNEISEDRQYISDGECDLNDGGLEDDLNYNELEENEDNLDNDNIGYDKDFEFDYRGYMSEPRYVEYGEKEREDFSFKEDMSKENKSGVLSTVFISLCVSFLVCSLFAVGVVFGTPYLREHTSEGTKEAFEETYRNKSVTIESTSDELIAEIAKKVGPSVVGIKTTVLTRDFFFGLTESNPSGSGIIFKENGYILTNNHVIESALISGTNNVANGCKIEVVLPAKKEEVYEAKVVGRDSKTDLAVLKIEKNGLNAAEFGNSDKLRVGEIAVAIGNPGGLEYMGSVTSGIISGLNRNLALENGRELKLIQTDAAINPGNSGGALVNSKGQVIGINTVKIVSSGYEGLGFAIPSNKVIEIGESLVEFKYVKGRPLIGITMDTRYNESMAKRYGMPVGVYVASVDLLSSAYRAGIEKGDIITEFGGVAIKNTDQLIDEKNKYVAGQEVKVKIYKSTTEKTKIVKIKLGEDMGTTS